MRVDQQFDNPQAVEPLREASRRQRLRMPAVTIVPPVVHNGIPFVRKEVGLDQ
jgi:hypothetical protein